MIKPLTIVCNNFLSESFSSCTVAGLRAPLSRDLLRKKRNNATTSIPQKDVEISLVDFFIARLLVLRVAIPDRQCMGAPPHNATIHLAYVDTTTTLESVGSMKTANIVMRIPLIVSHLTTVVLEKAGSKIMPQSLPQRILLSSL